MSRKLLSFENPELSGWVCDSCRFAIPKPRVLPHGVTAEALEKAAIKSWGQHECANYPLQRERTAEDFSRAKVRVVKDSESTS